MVTKSCENLQKENSKMIIYTIGDATFPLCKPAIIAHIVNNANMWGAGFVVAVSKRWSKPVEDFRLHSPKTLGWTRFIDVEDGITVANMYAQGSMGCSLVALEDCLKKLNFMADHMEATIHMPRIGCGIGGRVWEEIEPLIQKYITHRDVYVYDLP